MKYNKKRFDEKRLKLSTLDSTKGLLQSSQSTFELPLINKKPHSKKNEDKKTTSKAFLKVYRNKVAKV